MHVRLLLVPLLILAYAAGACAQSVPGEQPYCREFTQEVLIGGHRQLAYGTSCLQPDGSWQIAQDAANSPQRQEVPPDAIPYSPAYVPMAAPLYYEPYYAPYYPGPFLRFDLSTGGRGYHGHHGPYGHGH